MTRTPLTFHQTGLNFFRIIMQKVIAKKVGSSYLAWFENSNSWIQFKEPAWYVYESSRKGKDQTRISHECTKKYGVPKSECENFVATVQEKIKHLNEVISPDPDHISSYVSRLHDQDPYSSMDYRVGDSEFTIHYQSRTLEYYMHPPFAHLQTLLSGNKNPEEFFVYEKEEMKFLECFSSGKVYMYEVYGKLKRQLNIEIANLIHRKDSRDWMSYVHASAVSDGKKTILLASGTGSGKSTMAALLQTRGYDLLSDDFVPIEAESGYAYPFPSAISIKREARPVIEAKDKDLLAGAISPVQKENPPVWFVPPRPPQNGALMPKRVHAIVFLKYDPQTSCNYNSVDSVNAIKLFHNNAKVTKDPNQVSIFMDWILNIPCGTLEYGDTKAAMDQIEKLFISQKK